MARRTTHTPAKQNTFVRSSKSDGTGAIDGNCLYTLAEFRRQLRLSNEAWWAMRDAGLPHLRCGKQVLIIAADAIEWLRKSTVRRDKAEPDA